MSELVSVFQLGSSTVVTLPKKLGFKVGQKLAVKKTKNGVTLKLNRQESLLEILERTRGIAGPGPYYKNEDLRRKIGLMATKRNRKAW